MNSARAGATRSSRWTENAGITSWHEPPSILFSLEIREDSLHVVNGLRDLRQSAGGIDCSGTGIVSCQSLRQIAVVTVEQPLKELGAGLDVRDGFEGIAHGKLFDCGGHELHQAHSAFARNRARPEGRFLTDHATRSEEHTSE